MGEYTAVHTEVWEKLDQQARELFQLKKANTKLRAELGYERRKNAKLLKELRPEKQHYRNGQKRGRTRHG